MTLPRHTALVLAANRAGPADPLAQAGGVSHKAFIDIAGQPMLRRVVGAVMQSGRFRRVIVQIEEGAIEEAKTVLAPLPDSYRLLYTPAKQNIGTSVSAAIDAFPDALPLVITTGDNALHTADMVAYFVDALDGMPEDAALGLTPASYILEKYPEGNRAFHRFTDGAFSSCNIYALLTERSLKAPRTFNSGGQFAKRPRRIIASFGLLAFLLYKSRRFKLRTVLAVLSRGVGVKTAPVIMPFAEGPIDVDRMQDWILANRIVAQREGKPVPPPPGIF
jgi:CTP:molybdopterin cytidylyltransferase MocA